MEQSIAELHRVVEQLRLERQRPTQSPYLMVALGMAVPLIIALLAGGHLMGQIESNSERIGRQEAHLEAIDARVNLLAERQAAVLSILAGQMNPMQVPFENVPASPPPSSPTLRRH